MALFVNIFCFSLIKIICSSNTDQDPTSSFPSPKRTPKTKTNSSDHERIIFDQRLFTEQDVDELMNRDPLTAHNCNSSQFDCGVICINVSLVCDGKKDCPSGNDENNDFCSINHENASCSYPAVPQDRYEHTLNYTSNDTKQVPEFVQGVFKCKPGYRSDKTDEIVSSCIQKSWEPPIMSCRKFCPQINASEVEQTCYQMNTGIQVNCNDILWEGTVVSFICNEIYYEPTIEETCCLPDGTWHISPDQIECHPTCGRIAMNALPALRYQDFPWRVVIREEVDQSARYFSGTLVDRKMVITDAALFTRSKMPRNFVILVNDEIESWGPQKSYKIKNIHFLPARYQELFSSDGLGSLAILEPYDEVEDTLTVTPACVSPYSYPTSLKMFNNTGYMVVLNDKEDLRNISLKKNLKTFEGVCKINREKCNQYYGRLSTNNIERQLKLDSINRGTGLIKFNYELQLYFLEGVFSKQYSSNNLIFTFVSDYIEWIDEIREKIKNKDNITLIKKVPNVMKQKVQLKSTLPSILSYYILLKLHLLFLIILAIRFRYLVYKVLKALFW